MANVPSTFIQTQPTSEGFVSAMPSVIVQSPSGAIVDINFDDDDISATVFADKVKARNPPVIPQGTSMFRLNAQLGPKGYTSGRDDELDDDETEVEMELWLDASDNTDDQDNVFHQHHNDVAATSIRISKANIVDHFPVLELFTLVAGLCFAISTLLSSVSRNSPSVSGMVRLLAHIFVFLVLVLWCLLLAGLCVPGERCGWQRGLLVAT